jgi:hypothetical protein
MESYPESDPESSERDEVDPIREPSSEMVEEVPSSEIEESGELYWGAKHGDCGGVAIWETENWRQFRIRSLRSRMLILRSGLRSKIIPRMSFSSSDNGSIVFRKSGFLVKALYVESSAEACFHGLRLHVRLTRIIPSDHMSLGAQR